MFNLLSPFILDFFATLTLFTLCLLSVVIVKIVNLYVKTHFIVKMQKNTLKTKRVYNRKNTEKKPNVKTPKPFHSIEINPEEIDRIYVKKS